MAEDVLPPLYPVSKEPSTYKLEYWHKNALKVYIDGTFYKTDFPVAIITTQLGMGRMHSALGKPGQTWFSLHREPNITKA